MSREAGAALVDDEPRCLPPVVPGQWGGAGTSPVRHLDGAWAPPRQAGQQTHPKAAMRRIPVAGAASSTPCFYRAVRTAHAPPLHRSSSASAWCPPCRANIKQM
ncbi:hypothetical protein PVAP13_5KG039050 [Panicum virgatum]|uniref:Uncharacterized protein n=1 Tax=Panicum virgatum TaxID=38727 RepID=A0A8T0SEB3_PANVG|nr:hypothetical protein PVAP13_5KG039050 [Panicum virgatum]